MRILVTGGTGFIGRHLVPALTSRGNVCVCLDLVPPDDPDASPFRHGDIRSARAVAAGIVGCEAVVHLAAAHHDFGITDETFTAVNVLGTDTVLKAMDEAGVRTLVFLSSAAVYGPSAQPRHEGTPPQPGSQYGRTKLEAERRIEAWAAKGQGRQALVIRPTVVFGPHNFANMYTLIRQVDRGRYLPVGAGTNRKSLAYVGNLVDAILHRWPDPSDLPFRLYNYADTPDLTSEEIATEVYRALGRSAPRLRVPFPVARALALPFDLVTAVTGRDLGISTARVTKFAESETRLEPRAIRKDGFTPRTSLPQAIEIMVQWYQSVRHLAPAPKRLPPPMTAK